MSINPISSATISPTIMTSHSQLGNASITSNALSSLSDSSSSLVERSESVFIRVLRWLFPHTHQFILPDLASETTKYRLCDYWLWAHHLCHNPFFWANPAFCPFQFIALIPLTFFLPVVFLAERICSFFDEKISRFRARNLNAEDKKLIELRIQYRGGTSEGLLQVFYSLNSTTQEELRIKVFNKARAANQDFFFVNVPHPACSLMSEAPSELQWIFRIQKRNSSGYVSHVDYLHNSCFWDSVDDLIEEKINNSSL